MSKFDPDAYLGGTAVQTQDKKKREAFNPDAYLAAPKPAQPQETATQTLGRSTISMADSALNALTGTVDVGARALARAYYGGVKGMTGPELEQRIAQETTSPKDVFGRAFGVTGTAGYQQAPLRQLGTAVSDVVGENVIQPVAQATGLSPEYVGDVVTIGSVPLAGPAGRAAAATGRAAKATAQVPVDVARGALGRATGYIAKPGETPTGYQVPSSRIPLGETFIPAGEMAQLRQGMPISEGAIRPISELAPGPIMALSGGEIPVAGQAARAFGERLGETYRNPLTAAADIGSVFLTGGIPVLTAGRGALGLAQAGADAYLARKGFTSLTQAEREALNRGVNPFYTAPAPGPVAPVAAAAAAPVVTTQPLLPYTPAGQAAIAMPGPGRRVNIEGESFNLPYEIDTSRVQAARPQPQPVVGPVAPESIAAQPAQPVRPLTAAETAGKTAEQLAAEQKILDFINSRRGAVPEAAPEPKAEPKKRISQEQRIREREAQMTPEELAAQEAEVERQLAKSRGKQTQEQPKQQYANAAAMRRALFGTMPDDQLEALINKTFPSVETLKQKMSTPAAEDKALNEALRQRLEAIKAQGKYRGPKDVSQMIAGLPEFESKQAFLEQKMMNDLAGKPTVGTVIEGNKRMVYEVEYVGPFEMVNVTEFDVKTGKKLGPTKGVTMKRIDGK